MRGFAALLAGVLSAGVALAGAAPVGAAGDGVTLHEFLIFMHVLLFVFWLGPDIGAWIWSRKAADPALGAAQRAAASAMMRAIRLLTAASMSLMLTVAGLLSHHAGLDHPAWQMVAIVLLGPAWLALVLAAGLRAGTPLGDTAAGLEYRLRWLLVVAVPLSVSYAWLTGRLAPAPYVGSKLLLFALALFFGQLLHGRLQAFHRGVAREVAGESSPALQAEMHGALRRGQPYFHALWACLLLAALVGVLRPGVPPPPVAAVASASAVE